MPFTVSASAYKGGDYLYGGLSNFGSSLASGIQDWQKRQQSVNQFEGQLELMRGMTTTNEKGEQVPVMKDETYNFYKGIANQHKAAIGGELMGALKLAHSVSQDQRVPVQVAGQRINVPPSVALPYYSRQEEIARKEAEKVPTEIGGKTINLPPTSAAATEAEKARLTAAQQPRGMTQAQILSEMRHQREEARKIQEATPEYKFTQKYGIQPSNVIGVVGADAYQLKDPSGKVKGQIWSTGTPYQGQAGTTSTAEGDKSYWEATTPIFRATKYEINKAGTKLEATRPDPYGELVNVKGQHIPLKEVNAINERAKFVYQRARAALARDPSKQGRAATQDMLQKLGYDPELIFDPRFD